MYNLYIVPLLIAFLMIGIHLLTSQKRVMEKPFLNEWSNILHSLSFVAPFKWFINSNPEDKKVKDINKLIFEANISDKLSYRVFTALQITILIASFIIFCIVNIMMNNITFLVGMLFNIDLAESMQSPTGIIKFKFIVGAILLLLCLIPKFWLKRRAKKNKFFFLKDLPILQLFIILMLRSKRPINEVFYVLSKTKTRYKNIFEVGYRIYLRDNKEGLQYLANSFAGTKFTDTIHILSEFNEYSREDGIQSLENNMQEIIEYTNMLKRTKDLSNLVYSQASLFIPFLAVILLGLIPLAMYGSSLLDSPMGP
ncbi:hypothetical protein [Bacillus sp. NPDC094106]|uniref:hypothetical protein n=1 Tax=Bacillus sp. NPDC094106 TaxID=3363949 RepID=UPI0038243A60